MSASRVREIVEMMNRKLDEPDLDHEDWQDVADKLQQASDLAQEESDDLYNSELEDGDDDDEEDDLDDEA